MSLWDELVGVLAADVAVLMLVCLPFSFVIALVYGWWEERESRRRETARGHAFQAAVLEEWNAVQASVVEVTALGWHAEAKLWFFEDGSVRTQDGELLLADADGYFRYRGVRYRVRREAWGMAKDKVQISNGGPRA